MPPTHRQLLAARWATNESSLETLADLPAGVLDPARREAELLTEQDEIEWEMGQAAQAE